MSEEIKNKNQLFEYNICMIFDSILSKDSLLSSSEISSDQRFMVKVLNKCILKEWECAKECIEGMSIEDIGKLIIPLMDSYMAHLQHSTIDGNKMGDMLIEKYAPLLEKLSQT